VRRSVFTAFFDTLSSIDNDVICVGVIVGFIVVRIAVGSKLGSIVELERYSIYNIKCIIIIIHCLTQFLNILFLLLKDDSLHDEGEFMKF